MWEIPGLRRRELNTALAHDEVSMTIDEGENTVLVAALENKLLRSIQDCKATKSAWPKLYSTNSGRTMTNKLGLFKGLFCFRMDYKKYKVDHLYYFQSQCTRLQVKGTALEKLLKLALLIYSLTNLREYHTIITSINTVPKEMTPWDFITALLIEERKRINQRIIDSPIKVSESTGTEVVSAKGTLHRAKIIHSANTKEQRNVTARADWATLHAAAEQEKEYPQEIILIIYKGTAHPATAKILLRDQIRRTLEKTYYCLIIIGVARRPKRWTAAVQKTLWRT